MKWIVPFKSTLRHSIRVVKHRKGKIGLSANRRQWVQRSNKCTHQDSLWLVTQFVHWSWSPPIGARDSCAPVVNWSAFINTRAMASHARGNPVCRKDDCSAFDIGIVYQEIARFSDAEKFRFIQNIWKPDTLFEFPLTKESGGRLRRFKPDWVVRHSWLVYSKYLDGAFCLPCVCFGMECGKNGAKLNKLFRSPLTFWTTACEKCKIHSSGKSQIHNFSALALVTKKGCIHPWKTTAALKYGIATQRQSAVCTREVVNVDIIGVKVASATEA